jgi:hypothetical protein
MVTFTQNQNQIDISPKPVSACHLLKTWDSDSAPRFQYVEVRIKGLALKALL